MTVTAFAAEAQQLAAGFDTDLVTRGVWRRAPVALAETLGAGATVGFEAGTLPYATWEALVRATANYSLRSCDEALAGLRSVKSDAELAVMRRAAQMADDVFAWLVSQELVGRSEQEVAWMIECRLRQDLGADELAFPSVVACGPHGARPHHTATRSLIAAGALLVVDIGAVLDGYRSDATRTFRTGELDKEADEVYEVVGRARQAALAEVRAGAVAGDVHQAAADAIAGAGYGELGHALGHGVGLELHEPPFAQHGADEQLRAGQVLTVEPGVYLPGRFGVRIEDEVLVTEGGYEMLTAASRELVCVR